MIKYKVVKRGMTVLLYNVVILITACSSGYKIEGDKVYYEYANEAHGQQKVLLKADAKTFQVLKHEGYAKDAHTVFYYGKELKGADVNSFESLGDFYARDKNVGWYSMDSIKGSHGPTLKIVNDYYSTDGSDYFYTSFPLHITNVQKFKFVIGENDYQCWTTDGAFYYFNQYKVPSFDYNHFIIYPKSGGLSRDQKWVYFYNHRLNVDENGKTIVDTIDAATMKSNGYLDARDKWGCINVYHGREKCPE
ncbi:MAG: DKNYY domain-containing protein [Bacteroidota bacterium]